MMQYGWSAEADGIYLFIEENGIRRPIASWDKAEDAAHAPRWWLVRELLDNAQAETAERAVRVPHEEVVRLARPDQQLLQFPDPYPFTIRLDAAGVLNRDKFEYKLGFFAHPDGKELMLERTGAVLRGNNSSFILNADQYAFCKQVTEINQASEQTKEDKLRSFAHIKRLARSAEVVLDNYLEKEEVIAPEQIEIDVTLKNDVLHLGPQVTGLENGGFSRRFHRFPLVLPSYLVETEGGEKVRIALSSKQQEGLEKLKSYEQATGNKKEALVEHPETILDPDVFDLDLFGKRVIELGFYKPKFYPFVSPYKSQWIPGFVVETSPEERTVVKIESADDLSAIEDRVKSAKARGEKTLSWNGIDIPVAEAERISRTARKQFDNPDTPVTEVKDTTEQSAEDESERVLIIHTNIENEEYREAPIAPTADDFDHLYLEPPNLKAEFSPRSHQEAGIAWMQTLYSRNHPGGLLADDMGLGKTFQVLSFIKWHKHSRNPSQKPYLIVAPVALLENWKKEYHKFFESSPPPVEILHGPAIHEYVHGDVESHWRKGSQRLEEEGGIYLTNYHSLRNYQLLFAAVDWTVVALDEAQKIKNPSTQVTNAAKALKAEFKLPMTGTPVENSLVDLWCLMDFAVPGLLGSAKAFAKVYQSPLKNEDTDLEELGEQLRGELGVYLKRRLKSQVASDLPSKEVHRYESPMPREQYERYQLEIEQVRESKASSQGGGHDILRALHAMRIISDHPHLADRTLDRLAPEEFIPMSAKLVKTVDILRQVQARDEKVILYADRRVTQQMLARVLRESFGIPTRIINGDTPAGNTGNSSRKTRQELIDEFEAREGFGALVMSPVAAGVGLNITAANHVIHYARHWNPAKEDQATDRVYRIGQDKDVHVYYPMCTIPGGTYPSFDQTLDQLLERKRELATASLFPSERAEVEVHELHSSVFSEMANTDKAVLYPPLSVEDMLSLDPYLFEALVAALWTKKGCYAHLTPRQRDFGADVVAMNDETGTLIQVKKYGNAVDAKPVQELLGSVSIYENELNAEFQDLVVVTSSPRYTAGAREIAGPNQVTLIARGELQALLQDYPVTMKNIRQHEQARMERLSNSI